MENWDLQEEPPRGRVQLWRRELPIRSVGQWSAPPAEVWEAGPAEAWRDMLWQGLGPNWTGLPAWVGGILGGEPVIEATSTASAVALEPT